MTDRPASMPLSPLIGREEELRRVLKLWRESRLVTLIGQSGVGKSLLARTAAAKIAASGSVRCVHGASISGAMALLRALARLARQRKLSGPVEPSRKETDPSSPFYLLLDDLPAAAHSARWGLLQWLVLHPNVHLLIVARRPLDLVGERVFPLAPLAPPVADGVPSPASELLEFYGHQERGGESRLGETIESLCPALDGLPIALEAAARLFGTVSEAEIVRIVREAPLSLTIRGTSLRSILGASWSDLPADAQEYVLANAIWPDDFEDEAGTAVFGHESAGAVVSFLLQLGLLQRSTLEPRPRYRLSRLLRAWLLSMKSGDQREQKERLALYLLDRAERWAADRGADHLADADLLAMRWAWRWLAGRRDGDRVIRFSRALAGPLRHELGEPEEAQTLLRSAALAARAAGSAAAAELESALAASEATLGALDAAEPRLNRLLARGLPPAVEARARLRRAAVLEARGQFAAGREERRIAIATLRAQAPPGQRFASSRRLAWALWGLAEDERRLGNGKSAWRALDETACLFSHPMCPAGLASVMAARARLEAERGEAEAALSLAREGRALAGQAGDRPALARASQACARALTPTDPQGAAVSAREATAHWQAMKRPAELAEALIDQSMVLRAAGSPLEEVLDPARTALQLARFHGFRALESAALLMLTECYRLEGREDLAGYYLEQAQLACEQTDDRLLSQWCERLLAGRPTAVGTPPLGAPLSEPVRRAIAPTGHLADDGVKGNDAPAIGAAAEGRTIHPMLWKDTGPAGGTPLLIRLLGPMIVEGPSGILPSERLRPKEQRILARLALEPGQVVPREELLELFWERLSRAPAERSLRTVVSSLRTSLRSLIDSEPPRLITGRLDGYCLEAESCAVDAELFVRAVRSARAFPPGAEISAPALAAWRQAYEWYRGDLLGAFRYEDWCLTSRERLRDDFLDTLFHLARGALAASSYDEARQRAAQMVEIDPTEERAHRMLMRCFALLGRPAEALRQFERCRTALEEELGARPSPATFALLHAIRAGAVLDEADPAITVAATSGERR